MVNARCLHLSGCSSLPTHSCTSLPPHPPRSQRVLRIPGGSACPLGHWQGTPVLKQVTCRDPVWRGHLRRWPQLPWQPSFRDQEKSSEGLRLTQPQLSGVAAPLGGGNTFSGGPDAKPGLDSGSPGVCPSLCFQKTQSRFAGQEKPGTWPQLQPTLSLLPPLGLGCPICRISRSPILPAGELIGTCFESKVRSLCKNQGNGRIAHCSQTALSSFCSATM